MKPLYVYYKEEVREEHLLYAKEIAEAFYVTVSYKPYHIHKRMMSWLLDFSERALGLPPIYYLGRHGLNRVYTNDVAGKALEILFTEGGEIETENKTWKYKLALTKEEAWRKYLEAKQRIKE